MAHWAKAPAFTMESGLTLFSVPKPFHGLIGVIQRNAIRSWTLLRPRCEIVLFGDEEGTAAAAAEIGVLHAPNLACNEFGTPLVNDLLARAEAMATSDWLCLVNADMILPGNFVEEFARVRREIDRFMMVGRRTDLDVAEALEFGPGWEGQLRDRARTEGKLLPPWASDYFVYRKGLFTDVPPFAIGRLAYDNWFLFKALHSGIALVDATPVLLAVHQNHGYGSLGSGEGLRASPEARRNVELGLQQRKTGHSFSMKDVTHRLEATGIRRNRLYPLRRALWNAGTLYPIGALLRGLARVRRRFGLSYSHWTSR